MLYQLRIFGSRLVLTAYETSNSFKNFELLYLKCPGTDYENFIKQRMQICGNSIFITDDKNSVVAEINKVANKYMIKIFSQFLLWSSNETVNFSMTPLNSVSGCVCAEATEGVDSIFSSCIQ